MTKTHIIETINAAINLLPETNEITDDLTEVSRELEDMWLDELETEEDE